MDDLDMHASFQRVSFKYREVNIDNILRILIRCKMYFGARSEVIKMLKQIDKREECLDSIRSVVLGIKDDKEMDKRKKDIQELANYLQKVTQEISEKIDSFITNFKQFGKTFVYDHLVSLRYLSYRTIQRL